MKIKRELTAYDVLNEIPYYLYRIEMLKKQLREWQGEAYTIGAVDYSRDKIIGGLMQDLGDKIIKIEEGGEDIETQIARYEHRYKMAQKALNTIPSFPHARLIYLRYFQNKQWKEVAYDLDLSESYVKGVMHRDAVGKFAIQWKLLTQVK